MMRKGDLAHHPVADLLRSAAAERLSGGIEFDGADPIDLYLDDGRVYLAARREDPVELTVHDDLDDTAYEAAREADEARLRAGSAGAVAILLGRTEGGYFFHDLNDHPARGLWAWAVDDLLADATAPPGPAEGQASGPSDEGGAHPADEREGGLGRWAEIPSLVPAGPTGKPRPEDWAVLVAMADPVAPAELHRRLGWPAARLAEVLDGMEARGLLVVTDPEVAVAADAAAVAPAPPAVSAPPAAPGPPETAGPATAAAT